MKGITSHRRVKNDVKDAVLLADLLRLGSLPEAYIAPRGLRELRELVRYRAKLVNLRANLKSQVHAVMAKEGVLPTRTDMFGLGGQAQLDEMQLGDCYRIRIDSLRDLIDAFTEEIEAPELYLDASGHEPNAGGHRTNHPNRVGLAADTALTKPAPSGMPVPCIPGPGTRMNYQLTNPSWGPTPDDTSNDRPPCSEPDQGAATPPNPAGAPRTSGTLDGS
jgi:hypothetical protein